MKRHLRAFTALFVSFIMILSFQNCSQPVSVLEEAPSLAPELTGPANGGGNDGWPGFTGDGGSPGVFFPGGSIVGDGQWETPVIPDPIPEPDGGAIGGGGQIVCDPFSVSAGTVPGLKGALVYYEGADASSKIKSVGDMFKVGKSVDNTVLYFTRVHVPTRSFADGFDTTGGSKLLTDSGQVLTEWFGLRFESDLQLMDTEEDGYYQMATISDDGSVLELNPGSGYTAAVNNDGITSTRLRCGAVVALKKGQRLPMRLWYVQGPRTEIAVSVLWRKVASNSVTQPSYCGSTSLNFFNGGTGALAHAQMKADGWKVLSPGNYRLNGDVSNVCAH